MPRKKELLIVDGYNLLRATARYEALIDTTTNPRTLDTDPFVRARTALINDVANFSAGRYDVTIVFDGAQNLDPERPEYKIANMSVVFSAEDQSADEVIEQLVTEARRRGRSVSLVTSDRDIRSTVGDGPGRVHRVSSELLISELEEAGRETHAVMVQEAQRSRMTLEDRIDPAMRMKLRALIRGE